MDMHIHTCFRIWHPKRRRKQSLPWSHIPSPAPAPFSSWLSNQTPCRKVPGYPALLCFPAIPLAPAALQILRLPRPPSLACRQPPSHHILLCSFLFADVPLVSLCVSKFPFLVRMLVDWVTLKASF